ncbi:MAG: MMPL family transporter [Methylophilaceae bacterium]|nr:MMPL family transporter [Methylophilaceae bacterium]
MNFSAIFIKRPVATTLLTLGIVLAGLVSLNLLPVAPLPQVELPGISVSASLPGANPETMAATVATPLEKALGRIAGVNEMTSSSSMGYTRIFVLFDLNRDVNGAARDVQAAINAARTLMPSGMPSNPTYNKGSSFGSTVVMLSLTSDTMSQGEIYDAATTILAQKLSQVKGVGLVNVGGSSLPAVRVEIDPNVAYKFAISLEEIRTALITTNSNRPRGLVEANDKAWQIYTNDQSKTAEDFKPLIIAYRNGAAVRLSDVARVTDSVEDLRNAGMANGKPAIIIRVDPQANANVVEIAELVRQVLPALRNAMPGAIKIEVIQDRTTSIRGSLREMALTLLISLVLVVLVVLLFLRNVRATLIPAIAVFVSLLGTLPIIYLCGFSLNILSLMALTVGTGLLVDDAIVVQENVVRHMEAGFSRFEAALKGAREVGPTVLSMSLSLIAVFIPILLMGGIIGRTFREFAATLSIAVLVSLLVSLTLTPMMCAVMLKKHAPEAQGRLSSFLENALKWLNQGYAKSLAWVLRYSVFTLLILLATMVLNVYLYKNIPKGFFPQQDLGRLMGSIEGDQSISFQAMQQKLNRFISVVGQDPAVENVSGFVGGDQRNKGQIFVNLKPLAERKVSAEQVIARLRGKLSREPGARLMFQSAQDFRMGGRQSSGQFQYTLQANTLQELQQWAPRITRALSRLPELADVNSDEANHGLQTSLVIDRETASRLGLTMQMIDSTLNSAFGQRQVSTIYNPLNQYHVVMGLAPEFLQGPGTLKNLYITTPVGNQVPFSTFSHYEMTNTAIGVNHQGQFVATTLSFNLQPGVSIGRATELVEETFSSLGVPATVRGSFQGSARIFQESMKSQPWLILLAILTMYIVLGILYESLIHPITILSTLPSAGVGALLALMAFGQELSLIAMIGVILLIGIVQKNAIMMIDFALDAERTLGLTSRESIYQACLMRFRPILMTTMAAMLSAVPLAIGHGDGAELRQPLGIAIVGGLIFSQILTLYTTPVVYLYLDRASLWVKAHWPEKKLTKPLDYNQYLKSQKMK